MGSKEFWIPDLRVLGIGFGISVILGCFGACYRAGWIACGLSVDWLFCKFPCIICCCGKKKNDSNHVHKSQHELPVVNNYYYYNNNPDDSDVNIDIQESTSIKQKPKNKNGKKYNKFQDINSAFV